MKNILTIIPAAGVPNNNIFPSYSNLPDCMIPINSKPVIGHIIDNLIKRGIKTALILLNQNDIYTEKYVSIRYTNKIDIKISYIPNHNNGLVGTIYEWTKHINTSKYSWILIYLWDTIYTWPLTFNKSFITTSKKYNNPEKRCFIEKIWSEYIFTNKPKEYSSKWSVITGLYFFKNMKYFKDSIQKVKWGEMLNLIWKYSDFDNFQIIESKGWYDCWHIDNYYKAKIDFLKTRGFNGISFNQNYGTITKKSKNNEKIKREINRYLNMPNELKIFTPRIVDYWYHKQPYYEIEYYGYPSLWDMFVFSFTSKELWFSIIDNLFSKLALFKKYRTHQPYSFFYDMYYIKTIERLKTLQSDSFRKKVLSLPEIIINNKKYNNIPYFIDKLEKHIRKLYKKGDISFIHGDFCLSNILYDINNGIIKLIDPRGFFGEMWVYGDIKYDIAKLRHSLVGNYDFIVSDLFKVTFDDKKTFNLKIYNEPAHIHIGEYLDKIITKNGYNIQQIKLIEALLFLTMIPLHSDNLERQMTMFCMAIQKLSQIM